MKTKLLLSVALLCIVQLLFAQDESRKGKIYTTGKTYEGYISAPAFEETPQQFSIRATATDKLVTPEEEVLKVVMDNGITYEKFLVKLALPTAAYLDRKKSDYETAIESKRFLQLLVSGTTSLYLFSDEYGFQHFFYKSSGDASVTTLVYKPFAEEGGMYIPDFAYRNQLMALATGCSSANIIDTDLAWEVSKMIRAFKKINSCSNASVATKDHYTSQSKLVMSISALVGGASIYLNLDKNQKWSRVTAPYFGGSIIFHPKFNRQNFGFGVDIFYMSFDTQSETITQSGIDYKFFYQSEMVYARPFIRLYLSDTKVSPIFDLGASIAVAGKGILSSSYPYGGKDPQGLGVNGLPYAAIGINAGRVAAQFNFATAIGGITYNYFGLNARYKVF
jgi:hypothetical protein